MSEKRFFVKVYSNNEPFFFDEKQEYVEKRYTCEDVRNLHPMEYWQVVELLNEQQTTIEMYQRRVDSLKKTDFDFTIKQGEVITKFSLGEDKILFETTQDYETIQTLSKWLYSMYDEIQKLKKELKWKREEIKALIEESERDE